MKKKMNKKGFTLVELLAVVVVLAIVAAIAMRSITSIIKNNRIDSFAASINSAIEGAQLSCVQDGTLAEIESTVEGNSSVEVKPVLDEEGNKFIVKANSNGEFKGLKGDDATISRIKKGIKGLKTDDSVSCGNADDGHIQCTITYNTCTSSY